MARNFFVGAFAVVLLGLTATGVRGQDSLLDEMYGRGVHAYFSRDYAGAKATLTSAIDGGSRDPRVFYFRGLAHTALGSSEAAADDFKLGATLEVANTDRAYTVARSLERVQGPTRRMLETERQTARVSARAKVVDRNKARFEQLQGAEKNVLRGEGGAPAAGELPKLPAAADPGDPFTEEGIAPPAKAPAAAPKPATDPAPATDDPFGEAKPAPAPAPAKPAPAPPATDDPFGEAKPAPAPAPAPVTPAPTPPATDDPFGEAKPAPASAPAKPAPAPPAGDDPFGEAKPAPAPAPAKPAPPPAAGEDLFAEKPEPSKGGSGGGLLGSMWRAVGKSLPGGGASAAPPAPAVPTAPTPVGKAPASDPFGDDPAPAPATPPAKPAAPANDDPFK